METNPIRLVQKSEIKKKSQAAGNEPDEFDSADSTTDQPEYWKYYKKAKQVFANIPGYKLEISSAISGGYRWLKVLKNPANGLVSLSPNTRYLSPNLTMEDYEILQDFCLNAAGDDFKFFAYMLPVICLGEADNRSKLPKAILQELALGAKAKAQINVLHATDISKTNPEEVVSFIPELAQFPPALRASGLTWSDFLQWFYAPPEQEMFALHVGRAGTGPQGATLAGEDHALDHSYRKALIIKGQPSLGKTYVNEWLLSGFEFCGLKTAPIQSLSTNFGHGDWLASAWAYADDTNRAMLGAFYTSAVLKTACSNGLVKSEQKGVDSYDIKAMCAPIMLANDTDSRDSAKADSGMGDRLSVLATNTMATAKAYQWGPGPLEQCKGTMPAEVITFLCRSYEVSAPTLAAYFIRLCVDHFRSFTWDQLQDKVTKLSHGLYAQTNCSNLQLLANACLAAKLSLIEDLSEADKWQQDYAMAGNSSKFIIETLLAFAALKCTAKNLSGYHAVKCALFIDYQQRNQPVDHPWRGFRTYSLESAFSLGIDAAIVLGKIDASKGADRIAATDVMALAFKNLVDAQGVSSQYSLAVVHEKWREAVTIHYESIKQIVLNCRALLRADGISCGVIFDNTNPFAAIQGTKAVVEEELPEGVPLVKLAAVNKTF